MKWRFLVAPVLILLVTCGFGPWPGGVRAGLNRLTIVGAAVRIPAQGAGPGPWTQVTDHRYAASPPPEAVAPGTPARPGGPGSDTQSRPEPLTISPRIRRHFDAWADKLTHRKGYVWTRSHEFQLAYVPWNLTIGLGLGYVNNYFTDGVSEYRIESFTDLRLAITRAGIGLGCWLKRNWELSLGLEFSLPLGPLRLSRTQFDGLPPGGIATACFQGSPFAASLTAAVSSRIRHAAKNVPMNQADFTLTGRFSYTGGYDPTDFIDDDNIFAKYDISLAFRVGYRPWPAFSIGAGIEIGYAFSPAAAEAEFRRTGAKYTSESARGVVSLELVFRPGRFGLIHRHSYTFNPSRDHYAAWREWRLGGTWLKADQRLEAAYNYTVHTGLGYYIIPDKLQLALKGDYTFIKAVNPYFRQNYSKGHSVKVGPDLTWKIGKKFSIEAGFRYVYFIGSTRNPDTWRFDVSSEYEGYQCMVGLIINW